MNQERRYSISALSNILDAVAKEISEVAEQEIAAHAGRPRNLIGSDNAEASLNAQSILEGCAQISAAAAELRNLATR